MAENIVNTGYKGSKKSSNWCQCQKIFLCWAIDIFTFHCNTGCCKGLISSVSTLDLAIPAHRHLQSHRKMSVEPRSWPTISLSIYTTDGCLNRMMLSSVLSMNPLAFCRSSFSFTSDISPSNTEFWIQCRYLRQSFSIFPTRFSPNRSHAPCWCRWQRATACDGRCGSSWNGCL